MSKKKIFLAVPTVGSIVDAQSYFIRDIEKAYAEEVELVYPKHCVRRMFHDYARNSLVEEFLQSDADAIWFLDSDIVPSKNILDLVTKHWDKWIVSGAPYPLFISPQPGDALQVVMAVFNGTDGKGLHPSKVPYSGTDFVDGIATGCIIIKRELFSQLQKPYFEFKFNPETRHIEEGEDLGFCKKVNALGYKFFIDYGATCKHYKTVCLLDVNNYAIEYANRAVQAYDAQIKGQVTGLVSQLLQKHKKSTIVSPFS